MYPLRDTVSGGFLAICYLCMSLVFTHSFVGSAKEGETYGVELLRGSTGALGSNRTPDVSPGASIYCEVQGKWKWSGE
jgi:hypothetical protein